MEQHMVNPQVIDGLFNEFISNIPEFKDIYFIEKEKKLLESHIKEIDSSHIKLKI